MGQFNKEIHMKGCHLIVNMLSDTSGLYQFVFNPETKEFSEIYDCSEVLDYELENDGIYKVVTIQNSNATLNNGELTIGTRTFNSEDLLDAIEAPISIIGNRVYDIDDALCICALKKCLANLELKVFQELLKNCGSIKCKNDEWRAQRDFLFIAVWLIEHYLELGNIEKAQAIYESIQSCGSLCGNLLNNKNDCGCNG